MRAILLPWIHDWGHTPTPLKQPSPSEQEVTGVKEWAIQALLGPAEPVLGVVGPIRGAQCRLSLASGSPWPGCQCSVSGSATSQARV